MERRIGTGDLVEVTSEQAAGREGIEVGSRGKVVCMSWKLPGGLVVEFDEVQHHFNATELRRASKPKKHEEKSEEPEFVDIRCEICGGTFKIAAEAMHGHYSKRCRACKKGGALLFDRKRMRQNLSVLGMKGSQKLSTASDSPALAEALDAEPSEPPPPDEQTVQRAFAEYRKILEERRAEVREQLLKVLSSPDLRSHVPDEAIAVFVARHFEGKSLRDIADQFGVSKTQVDRLVKKVEDALPVGLSLEVAQEIAETVREDDGPRWEDTGWDYSDLHLGNTRDGGPGFDDYDADSRS